MAGTCVARCLFITLSLRAPCPLSCSFVILVAGFAFLANLLYGSTIDSFHNLTSSFSTLLRFPLGDFNYEELQTVG